MNKLPKLHLIASSDNLRPAMKNIHVANGIATATDGHIMARVNIKNYITNWDLLKNAQIPKEMWEQLTKASYVEVKETSEKESPLIHFDIEGHDVHYLVEPPKETFPNYYSVLNQFITRTLTPVTTMCFSPSLIQKLKRGCGIGFNESMSFRFYGEHKAILVTSPDLKGIALLMPRVNVDENDGSRSLTATKLINSKIDYLVDPEEPKDYKEALNKLASANNQ